MKKCILSAVAGALAMLIVITVATKISVGRTQTTQKVRQYEHVDYISGINPEECYICGNAQNFEGTVYWGEDNVGILNLNTFEIIRLEINSYDDNGNLIKEPVNAMTCYTMSDRKVQIFCHPDNAYASVHLSGVQYAIDRSTVQNRFCQSCLDDINDLWFTDQPPAEYAVVSFEDRTIQPILNSYRWFDAGNYGVDCDFSENGEIDLLVHYIAPRK